MKPTFHAAIETPFGSLPACRCGKTAKLTRQRRGVIIRCECGEELEDDSESEALQAWVEMKVKRREQ